MFVSTTFLRNVACGSSFLLENAGTEMWFPREKDLIYACPLCRPSCAIAAIFDLRVSAMLRICCCLWDFAVRFFARVTVWYSQALMHLDS